MLFGQHHTVHSFEIDQMEQYAFGLNNYNQLGIITKTSETIFEPKKVPFEKCQANYW